MIKTFLRRFALITICFIVIAPGGIHAQDTPPSPTAGEEEAPDISEEEYQSRNVYVLDDEAPCSASPVAGASGSLSNNIPADWRNLILEAAPTYPQVDPRIVAAVFSVEHNVGGNGWPEFKTGGWAESGALARGPFQFIPQTWFGWDTGIETWDRVNDNSAYSSSGMGTDGDGDGIRDPNNPKDAVHAAFKHHLGSAGKPIATTGYDPSKSIEENLETTIFDRSDTNLLYYAAKYNGNGANSGSTLASFRQGEDQNQEYVVAAFVVLASDFTKGFDYGPADAIKDLSSTAAGPGISSSTGGSGSDSGCGAPSGGIGVSADGFAFPLQTTKSVLGRNWEPYNSHPYTAMDILVPTGTPVVAARGGRVIADPKYKEPGPGTAAGLGIQILGDDGLIYYYTHLGKGSHLDERLPTPIGAGITVTAGQIIGYIGSKEEGAGTEHLHFDALQGPPKHESRGACSRADCPIAADFVSTEDALRESFANLPE